MAVGLSVFLFLVAAAEEALLTGNSRVGVLYFFIRRHERGGAMGKQPVIPRFYNTSAAAEHYLGIRWPRAIWQAVLEQAIIDAIAGPQPFETKDLLPWDAEQTRFVVQEAAQRWIDDEEDEPRRFAWVCGHLGLDPHSSLSRVLWRRLGNLQH